MAARRSPIRNGPCSRPGGDIVKEAIGAFPKVILAEGDYSVVARNEGKVYNGKFKVEPGFDREIEVLSR